MPPTSASRSRLAATRPLAALTLAFATIVAACGTEGTAADGDDVDALSRFELEEEMRIGSVDDPELGFSTIGGVALDRDSNVFVSERQERRMRVYDAQGNLQHTFGGRGAGPGEFRTLSGFGVVGDTVWVYDSPQRRITLFDRAGKMLNALTFNGIRIEMPNDPELTATVRPNAMRSDGLFTSTFTMSFGRTPPTGGDSLRVPRLLFDATGAVVDTIGYTMRAMPNINDRPDLLKVGDRQYPRPQPPSEAPLRLALDDGELVTERTAATTDDDATFTVTRLGPRGDTLFHRRFRYSPRSYDGAVTDTIVAGYVRTYGMRELLLVDAGIAVVAGGGGGNPPDTAALERAFRGALTLPPFQPPITTHRLGQDDSFWLRREETAEATYRWLVLNDDGSPRGEVAVPRNATMYWADAEQVWAMERDEFDVPWLVKYRIVPARER